jgi:transcriptional regulator with XRE-family HTH domain
MKKHIDLESLHIDGQKLKDARESKGISITDIAGQLTLSRAQIIHMEEGGDKPFYTPAHKLLAVRKYAAALELPYEEVVTGDGANQTMPVPEDAPESMRTYPGQTPYNAHLNQISLTDERMENVARNSTRRNRVMYAVVALTILLAFYAKLRGSSEEAEVKQETQAESVVIDPIPPLPVTPVEVAAPEAPVAPPVATPVATPVAAPVEVAAAPVAVKPAPETAKPSAEKIEKPAPAPAVAETSKPATEQESTKVASASEEGCSAEAATGNLKSWSPAYQRKSDSRLFVISPKGGTVCVTDGSGKSKLVSLRPMVGQAFTGKPPYVVRSENLPNLEMYMQGLRVKVPGETQVIRLVPTNTPAPEGTDSGTSTSGSPNT